MKRLILSFLFACLIPQTSFSQTVLEADGSGNTYELINSVLAPGYEVVEVPDCNHADFGRHIDEVFDTELNKYVFRFHIHTSSDNDRCKKFDRQRNEIKTYDKSPDNLLGVRYEKVTYKWKFKLDENFQPSSSFTHLHQIKSVGGSESSMPLITLTARKGNPDKLELRYAPSLSQSTLDKTDLTPMKGVWIEATETIFYDEVGLGSYEIELKKVDGGEVLFAYSNDALRTWKTDASFLRPKWGIYRSLNDAESLRDEEILFADFSIQELNDTVTSLNNSLKCEEALVYANLATNEITLTEKARKQFEQISIYNYSGQLMFTKKITSPKISIAHLNTGLYFVELRSNNMKAKPIKMIVQ